MMSFRSTSETFGGNEYLWARIGDGTPFNMGAMMSGGGVFSQLPPNTGRLFLRISDPLIEDGTFNECSDFDSETALYNEIYSNNSGYLNIRIATIKSDELVTAFFSRVVEPFSDFFAVDFKRSFFANLVGEGTAFQRILALLFV